jgi:hypothetical protein
MMAENRNKPCRDSKFTCIGRHALQDQLKLRRKSWCK